MVALLGVAAISAMSPQSWVSSIDVFNKIVTHVAEYNDLIANCVPVYLSRWHVVTVGVLGMHSRRSYDIFMTAAISAREVHVFRNIHFRLL